MLHRRDALLRLGTVGLGGLTLPRLVQAEQQRPRLTADGRLSPKATAKSCILVYLWGGPPQQETFDPKLDAPEGIRSQFGATDTVVPGIQICDQLPLIARQTDKLAIIRSYNHPSNQHEIGVNYTMTGRFKDGLVVPRNLRNRTDFPNVGSVVSYFSPPQALPAAVTIPRPIGHDGVIYTGTHAGFLGPRFDPLELQAPAEVNGPPPHSLDLPTGLDAVRVQSRVGLLNVLEQTDRRLQTLGDRGAVAGMESSREQAYRMLLAPEAKTAFDVVRESDQTRDRYGRNEYGEAFLLARRLVEHGVRLVTLVWYYIAPKDGNVLNVWDNHGGTASLNSITGRQMLQEPYCLPSLDRGYSALIEDLSQRGLLDDTLVAMMGEFGRTPKINPQAGRDHWGPCQSVVLAGGGIQGGQVYGASDRQAAYPTQNPVSPEDFIATIHHALGIPLDAEFHDQLNRPHRVCDGEPLVGLFA
ncbi:MAG TPA: DUF1501 domain-containing protein [Planctomycetaceae bacterium]|nr:DUF1501 domain-containing protein [Planctomycetaceae bacterium]